MNPLKTLQIPATTDECIALMRSYIYIDKFNGCVDIREISPYLVPGFILGMCAQIPFLYDLVPGYIGDVTSGIVYEVDISDYYANEMNTNYDYIGQLTYYQYTPTDCDLVLSVLLNAIIYAMYGHPFRSFKKIITERVSTICDMANVYPIDFNFPSSFRDMIKTTMIAVPELRTRILSIMCNDYEFPELSVWALVKRYIWMQIENYQMGTFLTIGEWYEAREKTLAHVDPEVVDEMKYYEECLQQMKAIANGEYPLNAFRIFNPQSMLGYLRQFPASAYCAIAWKKKTNGRPPTSKQYLDRFGIDTKQLDKLLGIPVKYTFKRKLKQEEIETISNKRFKQLDTIYTSDDV